MAGNTGKGNRDGRNSAANNSSYYAGANGAVTRRAGYRERELERRGERRRESSRSFPNRRRKIITGKDLTTPLRGRARVKSHKKVSVRINTVHLPKAKLPWGLIFAIVFGAACLCGLLYSYIALFEVDYKINMTTDMIKAENVEMQRLNRQFDLVNDPDKILRIAREEFGMIEERTCLKFI